MRVARARQHLNRGRRLGPETTCELRWVAYRCEPRRCAASMARRCVATQRSSGERAQALIWAPHQISSIHHFGVRPLCALAAAAAALIASSQKPQTLVRRLASNKRRRRRRLAPFARSAGAPAECWRAQQLVSGGGRKLRAADKCVARRSLHLRD